MVNYACKGPVYPCASAKTDTTKAVYTFCAQLTAVGICRYVWLCPFSGWETIIADQSSIGYVLSDGSTNPVSS